MGFVLGRTWPSTLTDLRMNSCAGSCSIAQRALGTRRRRRGEARSIWARSRPRPMTSSPARALKPAGNAPLKQQSRSNTTRFERVRSIRRFNQADEIPVAFSVDSAALMSVASTLTPGAMAALPGYGVGRHPSVNRRGHPRISFRSEIRHQATLFDPGADLNTRLA